MADDEVDDPQIQGGDAYRKLLARADEQASRDFDKMILTLAGGALALSLTLIRELGGRPLTHSSDWIVWGWSLLVGSLLVTLVSLLTSQRALRAAMENNRRRSRAWSRATHCCNLASVLFLIGGLVFVVVFASQSYGVR